MRVVKHVPPRYAIIGEDEPLIFEAGPIQGAPQWQDEAFDLFKGFDSEYTGDLHIASPRRPGVRKKVNYNEQVDWEEFHILRAVEFGGILCWFAAQDPEEPYEEGRAYAQTTRIEIGELFGMIRQEVDMNLVIGFDPDYAGGSEPYIRKRADNFEVPVFNRLDQACEKLFELVIRNVV